MDEEVYDIGILDSGMGGLTVAHSLLGSRPDLKILYFADTCHAPYGLKEDQDIVSFTRTAIDVLISHGISKILIACNTASVYFTEEYREEYEDVIFIDVLEPLLLQLKELDADEMLHLLCTKATARSGYFQEKLEAMNVNFEMIIPEGIVRLIESGQRDLIRKHIADILPTEFIRSNKKKTHIAYACTHYPLVKDVIATCWENLGSQYDAIEATAAIVSDMLPATEQSGKLDIIIHENRNEPYIGEILQFIPDLKVENIYYIEPVN